MSKQTIHRAIEKPLNIDSRVVKPGTNHGFTEVTIDGDIKLVFRDLETLKDFAQSIIGFAMQADGRGQL